MYAQQPRIEHQVTRGDVVGASFAVALCLAAIVLAVTFIDNGNRRSAAASVPVGAPSLSLTR